MPLRAVQHLYVHIPFCHRVCPYCAFYKHTPGNTQIPAFVDAVLAEARRSRERMPIDLRTVFLGGGTPTALSETHLERLLAGLREVLGFDRVTEFTLEANPMTVTAKKAAMMRAQGVTRVSLGVQAWDEPTLKTLGRDHSPAEAEETFAILREAGFPSLNIDLMFSVPGQTMEQWAGSLAHALSLKPDHISAYNLNYEEDTDFFEKLQRGLFTEEPERDADFFFHALDTLESAGFAHYEISNYACPGHESAHNAAYWFGSDYLGLGPSAVSTQGLVRWKNLPDTRRYIDAVQAGVVPQAEAEQLTPEQHRIERIALELRTARGVPIARVGDESASALATLQEHGFVQIADAHVRLTRQGKALADTIAGELIG
jgi:oxygen-independent coproporphyrinogen-3 oxidase